MAIEFALDMYGNRVTVQTAVVGKDYICPYCKEIIHLNSRGNGFLWHKPMNERNLLQRACPLYSGKSDRGDALEVRFTDLEMIYNGGLPLYLCATADKKYELHAIFPSLSENSYSQMLEEKIYILVSDGNTTNRYFVKDNIRYKICSEGIGLSVKIENDKSIPIEAQKKWLLGMRGLSVHEDIFRSSLDGGYRISLNSNIIINKEYILIGAVSPVQGILFEYKGDILLGYLEEKRYPIYSMIINEYSNESRSFIESKGYHLIKENDEIIAIWPPAHFVGNELICSEKEEYFFHKKREDQDIFNWDCKDMNYILEENNLFKIPTDGKMILVTDYYYKNVKEIRYRLSYHKKKKSENLLIYMKALFRGMEIDLPEHMEQLPYNNQIIINSNIKFDFLVLKGVHIIYSAKDLLQPISQENTMILDCKGFGLWLKSKNIETTTINLDNNPLQLNTIELINYLSKLGPPFVVPWSGYGNLVEKIRLRLSYIAQIMQYWGIKGKIPVKALPIIKVLEGTIKNE